MRLLIDANIILDVLAKREPFFKSSETIWKLCETEQVEGYISALSIANLVYVMRKELDPDSIEDIITKLKLIFYVADLTSEDLTAASELKWNDFEDALQSAAAARIKADQIITRNVRDYKSSVIPAFTPDEFLARF